MKNEKTQDTRNSTLEQRRRTIRQGIAEYLGSGPRL